MACAALAGAARPARAQAPDLVDLESSRQLRDSGLTTVALTYGAGRLVVEPGVEAPLLYRAELRYDRAREVPRVRYDTAARRLDVGLDPARSAPPSERGRDGSLRLVLSRHVPLDLRVESGAASSELSLGGLALRALSVRAGASAARVRFDQPTARPVTEATFVSGAGTLRVTGLANAAPARVTVEAGTGSVELDFGGRWTRDVEVDATVSLGGLTVRVPRDVGVRVEVERFLAAFDRAGLRRQAGGWESEQYAAARHRLRLRAAAALGRVQIERY